MNIKSVIIKIVLFSAAIASNSVAAHSDGIKRIASNYSVSTTMNRLEDALQKKGMTIFKRINHAAGGKKVGIKIRATELLIFGNPKIGTKLMQCSQSAALDLPQKALVYEDKKGQVWLLYNDPDYMAARHHLGGCQKVIRKFSNALAHFSRLATQ